MHGAVTTASPSRGDDRACMRITAAQDFFFMMHFGERAVASAFPFLN